MINTVHTDEKGRKYAVLLDGEIGDGLSIVIGPPEGLVDTLDLPEPQATRLHNILFDRTLFTYKAITAKGAIQAVLQELFSIDAQRLVEAFHNFEKETV